MLIIRDRDAISVKWGRQPGRSVPACVGAGGRRRGYELRSFEVQLDRLGPSSPTK